MPSSGTVVTSTVSSEDIKLIDKLHETSTRYRLSSKESKFSKPSKSSKKNMNMSESVSVDSNQESSVEAPKLLPFQSQQIWSTYTKILYHSVIALGPVFLIPTILIYIYAVIKESQEIAATGLALLGVYCGIIAFATIILIPWLIFSYLTTSD